MDECTHLIRDYLCKNPTAINWGYYVMSEDDLSQVLHQLKSFDRPDMYAILKAKIIIIEHFEFDASVCSRKGMKGIKEERLLDHRISSAPIGNEFHVGKGDYPISLANWQANFDMTFDSHYNKIPAYKEAIQNKGRNFFDKPIVVGSFIENQYSPIVYNHGMSKEHQSLSRHNFISSHIFIAKQHRAIQNATILAFELHGATIL